MAKHCQPFEHPADVGLAATADSAGELFEALAEGLADLICPRQTVRPAQTRPVQARAEDLEALAVDFLSAVLSAIQEEHFLVASAAAEVSSPAQEAAGAGAPPKPEGGGSAEVRAVLRGEIYDPMRHEIHLEVKAVTYHQLEIGRRGGQWHGRVILDL